VIRLILVAAMLLAGCASTPKNVQEVIDEHGQPIEGYRSSPAALEEGDHQLQVFVGIIDEEAAPSPDGKPQFKRILWCIAENEEKDTLRFVKKQIDAAPIGKKIAIYYSEIRDRHGYWFDGPDCYLQAIAVWKPQARRYQYLNPLYGTPWNEWLDMKSALKKAFSKGADAAVDIANPLK